MTRRAKTPFRFFSRLTLTTLTGVKARNLLELKQGLLDLPDDVVYAHTHRFLHQHQFLVPEPPNDFAYWATQVLGDERAGERLAAIDTIQYGSLAELRQALVRALEKGASQEELDEKVPPGKEFHFRGARRFSLPTGREAWTLSEFAEGLKRVTISSLYLHVFEARLRPPLGVNDFSLWLESELGEKKLAADVARLDPYTQTLEGLRARIADMAETRAAEASR